MSPYNFRVMWITQRAAFATISKVTLAFHCVRKFWTPRSAQFSLLSSSIMEYSME